ncbi:MAG: relaxase/mobilization nuclease domain-containing protein [Bifidobacterium sp.]|nr:relaxase/mobilization nuclease domain-containing protein [Bifidobacterium sp.]
MSTPIAAVVLASPSRKSVRLNTYVSTEKEGQKKGDRFVARSGLNGCIPEFAERQMRDNRKRWGKDAERVVTRNGRKYREGQFVQAYHVIQSFARDGEGALDPNNPDDWEKAHELGMALAKELAGKSRLATVTTQIDGKTGCLHNHIVIDSIEKTTGRSFQSWNVKHTVLAKAHDELLASLGYEQRNTLGKGREVVEKSELRALAKHQAWEALRVPGEAFAEDEPFSVAVLKSRVREALADGTFTTFDEFAEIAGQHGVQADERGQKHRGITYTMLREKEPHGDDWRDTAPGDRRRASRLGADFMMAAVEAAIARNLEAQKQAQATLPAPAPAPSPNVPNKGEKPTDKAVREDPATSAAAAVTPPPASAATSAVESLHERLEREMEAETAASRQRVRDAWEAARKPSPEPVKGVDSAPAATAPGDADVSSATATDTTPTEAVREDPATSAAAAVTPPPASAAASAVADDEYRSQLRDVRVRGQKRQELIDAVAAFDEQAVALLEQGEVFAETDVPTGIGRKFLDTYGDRLDRKVRRILEQRTAKNEWASTLFERAKTMPSDTGDQLRGKARRLRQEVKLGEYAMEDAVSPKRGPQVEHDRAASGPDLDQELT